jgi:hypothetical protein
MLPRSLKEDASAKTALLECAGAFAPRVEDQSEDRAFLCVVDIAGTEKLLGPAETVARNLLRRIRALGVAACATVSSNHHAAVCLSLGQGAFPTKGGQPHDKCGPHCCFGDCARVTGKPHFTACCSERSRHADADRRIWQSRLLPFKVARLGCTG